jgi:hypothetical protein
VRSINSYSGSFKNVSYRWHIPDQPKGIEELKASTSKKDEDEQQVETEDAIQPEEDKDDSTEQAVLNPNIQDVGKARSNPESDGLTQEFLMKQSKRFSLDLFPHLLFSRGPMVELLIKSNISRYTEFKSVSRILTILNGKLENVPSSR